MSPHTLLLATPALLSALLLTACSKPAPSEEPVRAVQADDRRAWAASSSSLEFAADVRARVESRLGVPGGRQGGAPPGGAGADGRSRAGAGPAGSARLQAGGRRRSRPGWPQPRPTAICAAADYKRYKELRDQNFISGAELERRDSGPQGRPGPAGAGAGPAQRAKATRPATPRWWPMCRAS